MSQLCRTLQKVFIGTQSDQNMVLMNDPSTLRSGTLSAVGNVNVTEIHRVIRATAQSVLPSKAA
jgi:hypothetical protein